MPEVRGGSPWKHKYQELIQEQEQQAKQFEQRLENLKRGLAKVSVAAQGQDPTLDAAIKSLRKALQKDNGEDMLSTQMDALEAGVHAMDKSRRKRSLDAVDALTHLLHELQALAISRSASRAINKLERRVKKASADLRQPFDFEFWLEQVVAAQSAALHSLPKELASDVKSVGQPSWWRGLFGGKQSISESGPPERSTPASSKSESTPKENDQVLEQKPDHESADTAISTTEDTGRQPATQPPESFEIENADSETVVPLSLVADNQSNIIQAEIIAILLALLADIDVPEDTRPVAEQLYQDLEKGITWADLVPTLDDVVTVVTSALGRDQQEFQQFLQGLNQQLLDIASFVSFVDHSQLISAEQTQQLNDDLTRQVSNIEAGFSDINQVAEPVIGELKQRVSGNLDTIVASLQLFQAEQREQQMQMTDQLSQMSQHIETMERESRQAAESLQRQREKLLRDTLTGVANREAYSIRLEQEYDRWLRYQRPLVVAVVDVDHFKQINDNYGHAAGDKVLKIIAKTLSKQLRKTDFIARFGGEEFVLLLPETTLEAAQGVLEKLRAAIETCPFRFRNQPLTITVSLGASQFSKSDEQTDTMGSAFDRADRALYQAKNGGRNQYQILES